MTHDNDKRNLLLIAPVFFGYYKEIIKEAELMGYKVTYICDAPSNSNISKAIGRINKNFLNFSTRKYFNNKVLPIITKEKYSDVLLVGGMTFAFFPNMIEQIKELNPCAKFIMYQWDSEKNLPYSTKIHKFFDVVYSFDRYDCKKNNSYQFLPLFYIRKYEDIGSTEQKEYLYDCSYVGTAHPQKYEGINNISTELRDIMNNQFIYHYMPSKLKFFYHKLLAPEFKKAKIGDFKMDKVELSEMMDIFRCSRCILDAPQAGQTGLTIRTLECLGAKKKLITTNEDIRNYDFYREENILIFNGNIDTESIFFKNGYLPLPAEIYEKYSLRNWLKIMLDDREEHLR